MENLGFIQNRNNIFFVDCKKKLSTLISNEINLRELLWFLNKFFVCKTNKELKILDVGAGTKPYYIVYKNYFSTCFSFDVSYSSHDISTVDFISTVDEISVKNDIFDMILCTEVLEHVSNPLKVLKEFRRIIKKEGVIFLTTPFMVSLHEMPNDYYRYTPSALKYLSKAAGLNVLFIYTKGDYFAVLLSYLFFPIVKFFYILQKLIKVPLYNPITYFSVVLPQRVYLCYWKNSRLSFKYNFCTKIYNKLNYITLGYVTILKK